MPLPRPSGTATVRRLAASAERGTDVSRRLRSRAAAPADVDVGRTETDVMTANIPGDATPRAVAAADGSVAAPDARRAVLESKTASRCRKISTRTLFLLSRTLYVHSRC